MSVDFHSFDGSDRGSLDGQDFRWWTLDEREAADAISATLRLLDERQKWRATQYQISARLYGNMDLVGALGATVPQLAAVRSRTQDRISYNVVGSAVDTVTSKIAKNKPKPLFLTNGGNYRQQRRAQRLNTFMEGVFYETEAHRLGVDIFRDACVWGDGILHVFERDHRIAIERVLPSELYVDEIEALYGEPRQLHRVKRIDRGVLLDLYPDHRAAILDANRERGIGVRANIADLVTVRESWHLPSGPKASDGVHAISIEGACLLFEPWKRDGFPFARMQWTPRLFGYWGQGLAEQLQGIQIEINKILTTIQRSYHLAGTFKILLPLGSKTPKEHFNNEIGSIIYYDGTKPPPGYVTPPIVPPEVYAQLERLTAKAYEQAGISLLSAASVKPAGLNSGVALREFNDIESDRFADAGHDYERLFLDVAKLCIATAKEIGRSYRVKAPGRRNAELVDWRDVHLDEDAYVMQCFPVSSLPNEPAGRLQTVQEYMGAGLMSQRQGRRLLDFPDLAQVEGLANAPEEKLQRALDRIVDDGEFEGPEPQDDLVLARDMALETLAWGRANDLEPEREELLLRFLAQIEELNKKAAAQAAAAQAASAPLAPPVAPTPSDLVPNAPQPAAMPIMQ